MNYTEIKDMVLTYSDRADSDIVNRFDLFTRFVEARVNKVIDSRQMMGVSTTNIVVGQEAYLLPTDFQFMRALRIIDNDNNRTTLTYLNPEQLASETNNILFDSFVIIGDSIYVSSKKLIDGNKLEMVYNRKLSSLVDNSTNWLSERYPDIYINGLMVEINAFVKDAQSTQLWDKRFYDSMSELTNLDQKSLWRGESLQTRIELWD